MCLGTYLVHSLSGRLLSVVSEHLSPGVFIRTRPDGKLFQLVSLNASTAILELCIRELLFADNVTMVAHTHARTPARPHARTHARTHAHTHTHTHTLDISYV